MRRLGVVLAGILISASIGLAQKAGPYKVLKTAKVGGTGGFDYVYADEAGRRLYIPRGAIAATSSTPAIPGRVTVFNLDTLESVGEIPNTRGNGAAVDPKSGHGFASSKPIAMWDTKSLALIKLAKEWSVVGFSPESQTLLVVGSSSKGRALPLLRSC